MSANVLFTVDIVRELREANVLLSYARRRSASSGAGNWAKTLYPAGLRCLNFPDLNAMLPPITCARRQLDD